mgnify:CR=1 FL=1
MTSFDFLSGFNNIDPKFILDAIDLMQTVEASDAEKEIMNMENYTIHKKRPVRRSVLVAAAVIALLCAMCVGAYAVNLFGIRDAVMGSQIVSDNYVNGEYAGKKLADGMTISMQGCIGSPEYEASREFNAFFSSYEANGYNGDALHQPLGDWGEAHGRVYNGLYTETLVNKFLEISEKYDLKPWDALYEGSGYTSLCEIIGRVTRLRNQADKCVLAVVKDNELMVAGVNRHCLATRGGIRPFMVFMGIIQRKAVDAHASLYPTVYGDGAEAFLLAARTPIIPEGEGTVVPYPIFRDTLP